MAERHREYRGLPGVTVLLTGIGALLFASGGCSKRAAVDGDWQYVESIDGNVRTVRTVGGSVWGGTARLVEEASIGTADGPDEYLFGDIRGITVGSDRIYVLDRQVPAVRVYDLDGGYLFSFGRSGEGPGEFRDPSSIAAHPLDGRIFVRDSRTGRINIYSADGDPLDAFRIASTFNTSRPFTMTDDGTLYTMVLTNPGADVVEWRMGMAGYGPEGALPDTIPAPQFDFEPWRIVGRTENSTRSSNVPFSPVTSWAMASNRAMVGGVSTDYRFEVRWPDGGKTVIERAWEKVPVQREEARWHEKVATLSMREQIPGWVWNGRAIPSHKPPFSTLVPDLSGRVWVGREGPGERVEGCAEDAERAIDYWQNPCWRPSVNWEVFRMTGEYLGEVDVPEGLQLGIGQGAYIKDDMVVVVFTDADDIPYVKRFRLVVPGGSAGQPMGERAGSGS